MQLTSAFIGQRFLGRAGTYTHSTLPSCPAVLTALTYCAHLPLLLPSLAVSACRSPTGHRWRETEPKVLAALRVLTSSVNYHNSGLPSHQLKAEFLLSCCYTLRALWIHRKEEEQLGYSLPCEGFSFHFKNVCWGVFRSSTYEQKFCYYEMRIIRQRSHNCGKICYYGKRFHNYRITRSHL